jgi:hypothetical protein
LTVAFTNSTITGSHLPNGSSISTVYSKNVAISLVEVTVANTLSTFAEPPVIL